MKSALKIIAILIIAASAVAAIIHFDLTSIKPGDIKTFIGSHGVMAPIIFVVLCSLRPLVLFPVSIFFVAGGLLFGPLYGWIYNFIGACFSATLAFYLSRGLGREFAVKILGDKTKKIEAAIEKEGFLILFYTRFIIPYDPLSYAAGLTNISFKTFAGATLISIFPSSLAYSLIGNSFTGIKTAADVFTPQFILPILFLLSIVVVPIKIRSVMKKKNLSVDIDDLKEA